MNQSDLYIEKQQQTKTMVFYFTLLLTLALFSLHQVIRTPSILLDPFLYICQLRVCENCNDDVVELLLRLQWPQYFG